MKVYIDTGVFVDYLINRSHTGALLRKAAQRGRQLSDLYVDAQDCFTKCAATHDVFTSCHTLFEIEDAIFRELKATASGTPNNDRFVIQSARPAVLQVLTACTLFNIRLIGVTDTVINELVNNVELQRRGVRAGDSLHLVTAIHEGAELIISADNDILSLDSVFKNVQGATLRCADTNAAKAML